MITNKNETSLHLVKYKPENVKPLYDIILECGQDIFYREGLSHWRPPYPIDVMQRNAAKMEVYGVHFGNELVGTLTAGLIGWKYNHAVWSDENLKPYYLYKLAVRPIYLGRGWGRWCLKQVEALTVERGCQVLRFDVIADHLRLRLFSRDMEYSECGSHLVSDFYGVKREVVFFEKVILQPVPA